MADTQNQLPRVPQEDAARSTGVRQRHQSILKLLHEKGFVTIDALARAFNVTPQTIRRDIGQLSENGIVHRYHGGAVPAVSAENVAYSGRKVLCLPEKQGIAALLARHVPDRSSIFINIGTTTEEVPRALLSHERLRVITNKLNVAAILADNQDFEIIIAGGVLRHRDRGIVGEAAVDFIRQFKVDIGIIGISGIDLDGTLLDFDYREVRAARAIIDNSRKVFLAADHTKFGRNAMVRLGNINEIDAVFTDRPPPASMNEIFEAGDVRLFVSGKADRARGEG